jgi:SAM-dependent methyltransferase
VRRDPTDRWNHNLHLHRVVLDAVPPGCERALDVGCGDGLLALDLRRIVPHVTGIDVDGPTVERARAEAAAVGVDDVEWIVDDVLTAELPAASFDLVASIAFLHHVHTAAGLERLGALVRPGGTLVVVGLGRRRYPADLPWDLAGAVATRWHRRRRTHWQHTAPVVWPPPDTHAAIRATAERLLPGVRYRRHVMFRSSLTWTKPTEDPVGPGDGGS